MAGGGKGRPPVGSRVHDEFDAGVQGGVGRGRGGGRGEQGAISAAGRGRGSGNVTLSADHVASGPSWRASMPVVTSTSGFTAGEAGQGGISRGPEVPLPNGDDPHAGKPNDANNIWCHGKSINGPGWVCGYCGTLRHGGGATRFKQHIAGLGVDVNGCLTAPHYVVDIFRKQLPEGETKRRKVKEGKLKVAQEINHGSVQNRPINIYSEDEDEQLLQRAIQQVRNRLGFERLHKMVFCHHNLGLRIRDILAETKEKEVDPCAMLMDVSLYDGQNPVMEWLSNPMDDFTPAPNDDDLDDDRYASPAPNVVEVNQRKKRRHSNFEEDEVEDGEEVEESDEDEDGEEEDEEESDEDEDGEEVEEDDDAAAKDNNYELPGDEHQPLSSLRKSKSRRKSNRKRKHSVKLLANLAAENEKTTNKDGQNI